MEKLKVALVGGHNPKFPDAGTPAYGQSATQLQALARDLQFDLFAGLPSVTTSAEAVTVKALFALKRLRGRRIAAVGDVAHGSHRDALLEVLAWTGVGLVERSPYRHHLRAG